MPKSRDRNRFTNDELRAFHARNHAGEALDVIGFPYGLSGAAIRYWIESRLKLKCRARNGYQVGGCKQLSDAQIGEAYGRYRTNGARLIDLAKELTTSPSNLCQRFQRWEAKLKMKEIKEEGKLQTSRTFYSSEFIRPITPERAMARR